MFRVAYPIKITRDIVNSPNLCSVLSDDDVKHVGEFVFECYERDVQSREPWFRRTQAAMDLAMQLQTSKSFPWQGASNVKFPLVTIAALQFHSRAYPAIINGRKVVNCMVTCPDPDGGLEKRAKRISDHMSYQLLVQDETWEAEQDRALINVPIVGVAWKKTFYDPSRGHPVSQLVLAKDLVVDYWAKSINDAATKSHIIPLYRNEVYERVRRGTFRDVLEEAWFRGDAQVFNGPDQHREQRRTGQNMPESNQNTPFTFIEQHCWLDLDDDGYAEPYIVTVELETQCTVRIVARWDRWEDIEFNSRGEIVRINANEYFTKIPFIPNPDGSIMDVGFGILLGPLNESVNSAINQIFDAGTLANTSGGFLGRGAKIRGGVYDFSPFSWNRVDSTGDDLRKNIYPLPVREPSNVVLQLLMFLVEYTNRIAGATDMLAGENPGQNTPAQTAQTMVQQGQKVYSAIFKRIWRSLKDEFHKIYTLNAIWLPQQVNYGSDGGTVMREDYAAGGAAVVPIADPEITSEGERYQRAALVAAAADAAGGAGYDPDQVQRMLLGALQVPNIDQVYPGIENRPPPPPDIKLQIEQMRQQGAMQELQLRKFIHVSSLQATIMLNNAKIEELQAKAFKLLEEGKAEPEKNRINAYNAAANTLKEQNQHAREQMKIFLETMKNESANVNGGAGTVPGMEGSSSDQGFDSLGFGSAGAA